MASGRTRQLFGLVGGALVPFPPLPTPTPLTPLCWKSCYISTCDTLHVLLFAPYTFLDLNSGPGEYHRYITMYVLSMNLHTWWLWQNMLVASCLHIKSLLLNQYSLIWYCYPFHWSLFIFPQENVRLVCWKPTNPLGHGYYMRWVCVYIYIYIYIYI